MTLEQAAKKTVLLFSRWSASLAPFPLGVSDTRWYIWYQAKNKSILADSIADEQ